MRHITIFISLMVLMVSIFPRAEELGADAAAPTVAAELAALNATRGETRILSVEEMRSLIALAGKLEINVFELLDDAYRYASAEGVRFVLSGDALRSVEKTFDMGGERIEALLPIAKTDRVEIGSVLVPGQEAMDVYLFEQHSAFIEIGTATMDKRFGFKKLEPRVFGEAYGVKVKRFPVYTVLDRLELYAPVKGAIYVKGINRPKRWNLRDIRPR